MTITASSRLYDYDCTVTPFHPSAQLPFSVLAFTNNLLQQAHAISKGEGRGCVEDMPLKTWRPFTKATPDVMVSCMLASTTGSRCVYEHVPTDTPRHLKLDFDEACPDNCVDKETFKKCLHATDFVIGEAVHLLHQQMGVDVADTDIIRMLSVPWAKGISQKKFTAHAVIKVRNRMWADFDHEKRFANLLNDTLKSKGEELAVKVMDMAVYTRNAYVSVLLSLSLRCFCHARTRTRCCCQQVSPAKPGKPTLP